jgi:hypothetical protein
MLFKKCFLHKDFRWFSFMIYSKLIHGVALPQTSLRQRHGKQTPTAQSVLESKVLFYFIFRVFVRTDIYLLPYRNRLRSLC